MNNIFPHKIESKSIRDKRNIFTFFKKKRKKIEISTVISILYAKGDFFYSINKPRNSNRNVRAGLILEIQLCANNIEFPFIAMRTRKINLGKKIPRKYNLRVIKKKEKKMFFLLCVKELINVRCNIPYEKKYERKSDDSYLRNYKIFLINTEMLFLKITNTLQFFLLPLFLERNLSRITARLLLLPTLSLIRPSVHLVDIGIVTIHGYKI
ncbi:hypothetical protein PUN28_017681 [Cardiocondyla obscurior]|uniref:Ribosomal protein L5 n=1 Tax=Cardiocondyla obscurior TaxID=286306 RepID=A0AAW2EK64_9HYME